VQAVPLLLDGSVPVVATVVLQVGERIAGVKARADIRLAEITAVRPKVPARLPSLEAVKPRPDDGLWQELPSRP
jgi:hypothetical protein